ncbi:hypothetical protein KGM_201569 [Danaus plexippus plexippus]|uniref:Tripartite motif-containing protein 45 n=1 Tax=Danaus plexippus plexippus TaxID=278856 RepID=A0A212EUM6_DANPL|nr:hypothetical protein KGM_201569 [Danaus plexippus plexippus]
MEVDRILYIFGSFSRKKRERRKSLEPSSISAGNSPLKSNSKSKLSRPSSQNAIAPRTSAYEEKRKAKLKEWECGICKSELVEPRLLACLHSFCTDCLLGLHCEGDDLWEDNEGCPEHDVGFGSASAGGSGGSGYETLRHSVSESSLEKIKYGIVSRKVSGKSYHFVVCPLCGSETQLPLGGVSALSLNYVLLRRMTSRDGDSAVLCDLCCADNKAESRCSQCLVSVCTSCGDSHTLKKGNATHLLEPLAPFLRFCGQHPKVELTVYCATCQQVICRDCSLISHGGHALEGAGRAAAGKVAALRDAMQRAGLVPDHVQRANRILDVHARDIDEQASRVESEIRLWSEEYRRSLETHARALCAGAVRARARYRARATRQLLQLEQRAEHAREAVKFAEELLSEGKEDEILSLSGPVLKRLQNLTELQPLCEAARCELRFAPNAPAAHNPSLVGRLYTMGPDPQQCVLDTDGLQDLRVDCQHTAILELRDSNGDRIWCGGETVCGYFRRRDSSSRPAAARVRPRVDGSYALHVAPRTPGHYLLAVTVDNQPIKGSPFSCSARLSKSHSGQFHCCSFCSSGGRRDATCGCGSSMGGGYKGCGHGHAGWPGTRHWSCCGGTSRHAPCTTRTTNDTPHTYHVSL